MANDAGDSESTPRLPVAASNGWIAMLLIAVIAFTQSVASSQADPPQTVTKFDRLGFEKVVAPFLAAYCVECHAGAKPKGSFCVDKEKLPVDFLEAATRSKWKEIVQVLHAREMPPKKSRQPSAKEIAAVIDWITAQSVQAERTKRETAVVLRRLNREEYRNTIRDLVGIDFDVSGFPQDPPAGGFDNNGAALTMSPLHVETYLNAARQIVDRALVEGKQPESIRWRFHPKAGPIDQTRLRLDATNNAIVNGGNNTMEGDWVVIHHESWDKPISARDFRVPTAGTYKIRISAASKVPGKNQVIESAETILAKRLQEQNKQNPKGEKYHKEQFAQDLKHFQSDRIYDYGPARIKLVLQLGPQPRTLAEFDADGTKDHPKIHEYQARFTTESAGISLEYAYSLPRVLENFWMQGAPSFARPELLVNWFEVEGPIYDAWPPAAHMSILFSSPLARSNEAEYVRQVLTRFMERAFRGPVSDAEVRTKLRLFTSAKADGLSLVEAIKRPLISILISPRFLYLSEETQPPTDAAKPLNDHQLANRLSYFLWSSMPDEPLTRLARQGELKDRTKRIAQVDRMLADPKSEAFIRNFAGQWLSLRDVGNNPPAADLYPQYDRHLETSMVKESEAFFREILTHNLDARNFLRSDFVVINERLARFYGIENVKGDEFRRVPVGPEIHRGGIVTQASILTVTSNGTRTSPVKRGTWILKTLLGIDPGLPVANAGEIAPKVPGIDKATVRKRLEIHRTLEQCARCHNKIDPLGFALENYNASGEWRDREGFGYKGRIQADDPKIDARSETIDGTQIEGVAGLQEAMLKQEDLFFHCLASKMMTYALGRELALADEPAIKNLVGQMKKEGGTLRSLIRGIATSAAFEQK